MLTELARHYGVTRQSDWGAPRLSSEIKAAAKRSLDSIEQIYDDYAAGKGGKAVDGEVFPPSSTSPKATPVTAPAPASPVTVNTTSPQPIVNLSLPAVTIRQGDAKIDKPWAHYAIAAWEWLQPFALGAMVWATFGAAIKRMIGG